MINTENLRTWIEIDKSAIEKNYKTFRSLLEPDTKLACVVKSNAYGHDLLQFSKEIVRLGADFLCVDDIDEALKLRAVGIETSILVLGYIPESRLKDAEKENISITISNFKKLAQVKNLDLKIHIKVDTGLGRQGFVDGDMEKLVKDLEEMNIRAEGLYSHLAEKNRKESVAGPEMEGLYSHFADAENPDSDYSPKQVKVFEKWVEIFSEKGWSPIKHISATSATMIWPEFNFDMVRIGIGMYGHWPSKETQDFMEDKLELYPALVWKSRISEIKNIKKGRHIGYDLTEKLDRDSRLAIIPVGYYHGYDRGLSGIGQILINGKTALNSLESGKAKIMGRVAMCMIIVDITDIDGVEVLDDVVLLGAGQNAGDIAEKVETINYEILTRINSEIPRFYI